MKVLPLQLLIPINTEGTWFAIILEWSPLDKLGVHLNQDDLAGFNIHLMALATACDKCKDFIVVLAIYYFLEVEGSSVAVAILKDFGSKELALLRISDSILELIVLVKSWKQ